MVITDSIMQSFSSPEESVNDCKELLIVARFAPVSLSLFDWSIIIAYLLFALGVGAYYAKRASRSSEEYYLAGRTLPWWVLGTSMVATTFAADTPLVITEYLRDGGIWKNWFWWNWGLSTLLGIFLFARLWRRSGVLTDNEILEIRYSGKPAAFLRAYKAVHFGIIFNLIVMGWVLGSMSSVLAVTMGIEQNTAMWGLVVIALVYSLLSGFWGVVVTDVVQFGIAMIGAIILAFLAVQHVGGMSALLEKLEAAVIERAPLVEQLEALEASGVDLTDNTEAQQLQEAIRELPPANETTLQMFPPPTDEPGLEAFLTSPFFIVLVYLLIMPWNHHGTDGSGYIIQRMMSAKDERHALLGTLWYKLADSAIRVWPWIIVAIASLVMFPDLVDFEDPGGQLLGDKAGYPLVMQEVLGSGLKGLLIVSFLAAFMSTIDSHLNWGSSYLVNDIYKRFWACDREPRHYVFVGRLITVGLMVLSAALFGGVAVVGKAWSYVWAMGAGIGLVLILRWFWWRVNAWSEITALATSFIIATVFHIVAYVQTANNPDPEVTYSLFETLPKFFGIEWAFHLQLLIIVPICLIAWLTATFLTAPEPEERLRAFYKRVQPGGFWGSYREDNPNVEPVSRGLFLNFIGGMLFIYGATFAIGYFVLLKPVAGFLCTAITAAGFAIIWFNCLRHLKPGVSDDTR